MSYVLTVDKRQAFIVRLPGKFAKEKKWALNHKILNMGWEDAIGLTYENLSYEDFRDIMHTHYFPGDDNYRRAGRIAINAWRFIKEMAIGNYILLPNEDGYYIAIITSHAYFEDDFTEAKKGYKRTIKFLNDGKPISGENIPKKLQDKLNTSQSVTDVSDLIQEVEYSLRVT
ncbi:MAG: hypothetical protein HGN29_17755 [Asgard group archaeon]|nr:hypothetical protein [Asgard group archaeon]